jgi:MFS family permease
VRHAVSALRHRNYQLFFGGQIISLTGTWMQQVAQAWLVYRLTHSSALLGLVAFSNQIPVLLLSPIGGAVADRFNRHRVVVWTQTACMLLAFALATLTLGGWIRVWHLFVLSAALGVVYAFDIPARQSFIVTMVSREDMMNAIALNSSMVNGARVVGPAIAGALVAIVGEGWCFFLNGVSYIAVIAGLLLMTIAPWERPAMARSAVVDIVEGFSYVAKTVPVRALLILLGIASFTSVPYTVLMPIVADQVLHGGAKALGFLMGASGLGALAGALSLAFRRGVRGLGGWVATASIGLAVALVLFAMSRSYWLSLVLLVPVGANLMVLMAGTNTLVQAMSPDVLRGRVMAVYSMMVMGLGPFGALYAGAFADRIGAPATIAVGGVICLVAGILFRLRLPAIRGEGRALLDAQGHTA